MNDKPINDKSIADNKKIIEAKLLSIVREFVLEFKNERAANAVMLDARIEKDLGIDSLGRVELFLRVERAFEEALPDNLITEADTIEDIAKVITSSYQKANKKVKPLQSHETIAALEETKKGDLSSIETLFEVLEYYANANPNRPHLYLIPESGNTADEKIIRYGELYDTAKKVAAGLQAYGLEQGDTVAIMLPTGTDFFYSFFGIMLAGGIPVPIYPPFRADKLEEYSIREARILNNAGIKLLITFSQAEALSKLLRVFIPSLTAVVQVSDLMQRGIGGKGGKSHRVHKLSLESNAPAMIQYTSGSTSDPKGVLLSHNNLLSNIRSIGQAIQVSSRDVGVSWLPLYHDMGLIGSWLSSLYHGFPLTVMSPLTFLSRPERWLWAIHYHRGTLSAGPNFAYELCIRKIRDEDIVGLDLSSWRLAFNGAESINPETLERFIERFTPYGFKRESSFPVYGLAESTVALTVPPIDRGPKVDVIIRDIFETENRAVSIDAKDDIEAKHKRGEYYNILKFVACGSPISNHEIRIVDEENRELPDRNVGTLQFSGPSSMMGYYHNRVATEAIFRDGWWDSGDYAYIAEGDVYITGRKKDIIIKAGRNIYPQELEEVTAQVSGIRKGCVVAFGINDPHRGTEKLVIVAETHETDSKSRDNLSAQIIEKISVVLGMPPDEVFLVAPRTIPKTSSGKLQRSLCKSLYLQGKLSRQGFRIPPWVQMGKLAVKGAAVSTSNLLGKIGRWIYTGYIFLLLLLFLPFLWLCLTLLPRNAAKSTTRFLIVIFLMLSFCRFTINGRKNLQQTKPMVYVANHASYFDSVILFALLPKNTLFIGKKELRQWPFIGKVFKKFNYLTVDRMDFAKNLEDTQHIIEAMKDGQSIVIYPEGTFTYATGLRPFKMGAFKVAVDTGTAICPIGISGARQFMRGDSVLFAPSKIVVTIGDPIAPEKADWSEVSRLHSLARKMIAENCGEQMIDLMVAGPP